MDIKLSDQKSSRKFWMSIATFISMMTVFFGGNQDRATQITALIMAGGASVAYIVGEGFADAASAMNTDNETEE